MLTREDIIQGIRDIIREPITSTDKVGAITNFINSVEEGMVEEGKEEKDGTV